MCTGSVISVITLFGVVLFTSYVINKKDFSVALLVSSVRNSPLPLSVCKHGKIFQQKWKDFFFFFLIKHQKLMNDLKFDRAVCSDILLRNDKLIK